MYYYSPFRKKYNKGSDNCPFCSLKNIESQTIKDHTGKAFENEHYRWVVNTFPKFEGHTMLVPKRHLDELHKESPEELLARHDLLKRAVSILQNKYPNCGIEHFIQTGPGSSSTIPHLHWHLLPAHLDDNLRSFEKMGHFYTMDPDEEKVIIFPQPIKMSPSELLKFLSQ